jgi:hypothetical protein
MVLNNSKCLLAIRMFEVVVLKIGRSFDNELCLKVGTESRLCWVPMMFFQKIKGVTSLSLLNQSLRFSVLHVESCIFKPNVEIIVIT